MKYFCAGCDLHRGVGPLLRQLRLLPEPGRDEPVLPLLHTEPLTRGIPGLHQSLRQYQNQTNLQLRTYLPQPAQRSGNIDSNNF